MGVSLGKRRLYHEKIIYIKTIQLLIIDGIMLAFLTFKEGLTWDWILIYSGLAHFLSSRAIDLSVQPAL